MLNPGTRFRPLSLELPQALFPIAGVPLLEHHIDACAAVRKTLDQMGTVVLLRGRETTTHTLYGSMILIHLHIQCVDFVN